MENSNLKLISKLLRYYSIKASTQAGSGHPTSSLSAADLMSVLYFKYLKYDFKNPHNIFNDRVIFSKGHASPLLYSLFKVAGVITEDELMTYRTLTSPLQGHPTPELPYVDVATGSLGMGLSYGLGMALGLSRQISHTESNNVIARSEATRQSNPIPKVYVLLGDGEMAEGSNYEALELAAYYNVNNLVGILDVNRLGQTGPTMVESDIEKYKTRIESFGWNTICIDGHNIEEIDQTFASINISQTKPTMIIAKTIKGKGISFLEDQLNWHGKTLNHEQAEQTYQELNITKDDLQKTFPVQLSEESHLASLDKYVVVRDLVSLDTISYKKLTSEKKLATRKAYGIALSELAKNNPKILSLDGETFNSTFAIEVQKTTPDQFYNMFIAEQNMVSTAVGLSKTGYYPFVSTFSAFLTRAFDQIRMASISEANLAICGSHAGVSIGEDGASQMGIEDISMVQAINNSTIFYPSDSVSTAKLLEQMPNQKGISYLRTTREDTDILYDIDEEFPVGQFKVLKQSDKDICLVIGAGITLHEALNAHQELINQNLAIRVIDLYCIKPIDEQKLREQAQLADNKIVVVEDHRFEGGIGDAVLNVFAKYPETLIHKLAITQLPHSGKAEELRDLYGISAQHIVKKVKEIL